MAKQFRFEGLEIWQRAAAMSDSLFALCEQIEARKYYRFAEQLRAAVLSITNNIAEGSGSLSNPEFANFLNIARRSVFETANMLVLFSRNGYIKSGEIDSFLCELEEESRMIVAFIRTLRS
jgi:four helix bundle protein